MPASPPPALRFLFYARLLFSAVVAASLMACAFPARKASVLQGKHAGGSRQYRVEVDGAGRHHGWERWWYENGRIRSEAFWVRGRRDGVYQAWYPDGTPWYRGRDSLGVAVDTVRVWYPHGGLQSLAVYERGQTVFLETWDSAGRTAAEQARWRAQEAARREAGRVADSAAQAQAARAAALADWIPRVRTTVETYWKVSEGMKKTPRRAVARLRVSPEGRLLGVTWIEKSGSPEFDRRAAQALAKIRRFPPPPPELGAEPLTLRYEFATTGSGAARRRLQVREREAGEGGSGGAEGTSP